MDYGDAWAGLHRPSPPRPLHEQLPAFRRHRHGCLGDLNRTVGISAVPWELDVAEMDELLSSLPHRYKLPLEVHSLPQLLAGQLMRLA